MKLCASNQSNFNHEEGIWANFINVEAHDLPINH